MGQAIIIQQLEVTCPKTLDEGVSWPSTHSFTCETLAIPSQTKFRLPKFNGMQQNAAPLRISRWILLVSVISCSLLAKLRDWPLRAAPEQITCQGRFPLRMPWLDQASKMSFLGASRQKGTLISKMTAPQMLQRPIQAFEQCLFRPKKYKMKPRSPEMLWCSPTVRSRRGLLHRAWIRLGAKWKHKEGTHRPGEQLHTQVHIYFLSEAQTLQKLLTV